jgi:hypothetical protein
VNTEQFNDRRSILSRDGKYHPCQLCKCYEVLRPRKCAVFQTNFDEFSYLSKISGKTKVPDENFRITGYRTRPVELTHPPDLDNS